MSDDDGDPDVLRVLRTIEESYSEQGWDLPHVIVTMVRVNGNLEGSLTPMLMFEPHELPLVTETVVKTLRQKIDAPLEVVAVGFLVEGWATPPQPTLADAKAYRAASIYRSIAEDPNRVEVRYVMAIDTAGWYYHVGRQRGEEQRAAVMPLSKMISEQLVAGASDAHFEALCQTMKLLGRRRSG